MQQCRGSECVTVRYTYATNSIKDLDSLEQMIMGQVVVLSTVFWKLAPD